MIHSSSVIDTKAKISKNVKIGPNSKIQSHSFICDNTTIGENCFIGHSVVFVNDKFLDNKILPKTGPFLKTIIVDNVLIGSNATILPLKMENKVTIEEGSVVTKKYKKKKVNVGNQTNI